LCLCASPGSTSAEIEALSAKPLNWDVLLNLAEAHGVIGLLCAKLQQSSFAGIADHVREKLLARMRAQHLFNLSLSAELFRVGHALSTAGIDTILVKGPVTSLLAYGDPSVRSYTDLDLLVRQRDITSAFECMRGLGFQCDLPESAIRAERIPGEYVFHKPERRLVELHTERSFRYYPKGMPIENLFSRSRKALLENREVRALSLEDELVFDCVHGAKDFWARLMWVADVAALVTHQPDVDWQKTTAAAAEVGAGRMLRVGVQLAASLLGISVPAQLSSEIENDKVVVDLVRRVQSWLSCAETVPPPLPERAKFRLEMGGGGLLGASYLLRLTLSPTQEDWAKDEKDRRPWLLDAMRRPFRLLRKHGSSE
jgi:hypothetical protein